MADDARPERGGAEGSPASRRKRRKRRRQQSFPQDALGASLVAPSGPSSSSCSIPWTKALALAQDEAEGLQEEEEEGEDVRVIGQSNEAPASEDSHNKADPGLDRNQAYREHLELVLRTVFVEREDYCSLATQEEREQIECLLNEASVDAKSLLARIFPRRGPWFRASQLAKYFVPRRLAASTVSEDDNDADAQQAALRAENALKELCRFGFAQSFDAQRASLEEGLSLAEAVLTAAELQQVLKHAKLDGRRPRGAASASVRRRASSSSSNSSNQSTSCTRRSIGDQSKSKSWRRGSKSRTEERAKCDEGYATKAEAIARLRFAGKSQRTVFGHGLPVARLITRVAKDEMVAIQSRPLGLLQRAFSLYYLTASMSSFQRVQDGSSTRAAGEATSLHFPGLLASFGKLRFADYTCKTEWPIFRDRRALDAYELAVALRTWLEVWVPAYTSQSSLSSSSSSLMEPDTVPPEETLKVSPPEVISLLCDDEDDDDDAKVSVVDENSAKNEINVEAGTSTEPSSCVALQEMKGEARDVTRGSSPNKTSHEMKAETRHETDPSRANCKNVTAQTSKINSDSKASMSTSAVDIIIDIVSDDEKQSIGDAGENPSISNAEKVVQRRLTEGRRETATRQSPHTSVFDLRASSAIKELKLDTCTAQEVVNILISYLEECVISEEAASVSGNAPRFLAQFRASYALAEAISTGIEWIEKAHDYKEAARRWQDLLRLQTSHRRRGYWYNRLSIDQKHLGASQAAAETLVLCLLDRSVPEHSAHRIEAEKRLTKLLRNRTTAVSLPHAKNVLTSQSGNNGDMQVSEITIFGRRRASAQGRRPRVGERCEFFSAEDTPSMYCHVEEFVLEHFEQTGGWLGMHCEGQIFRALFAIFMWDAIFDEGVPDVFQTPFQHGPLDLFHCSGVFVDARRAKIEAILGDLQSASSASLAQRAKTSWDAHEGVQVCGMRWDAYPRETLACVAACIGPKVLVAILRRLCEDYNHWAGGGPDLLLYRVSRAPSLVANEARPDLEEIDNLNLEVRPIDIVSKALPPTSSAAAEQQQQQQRGRRAARHVQPLDFSESTETGVELRFEAWFLEVKSETDRLSHKQSGWLRYLESAGARAGVCHVRAS